MDCVITKYDMRVLNALLSEARKPASLESIAEKLTASAKALYDDLMDSDQDRLKAVISQLVAGIELSFGNGTWGSEKSVW